MSRTQASDLPAAAGFALLAPGPAGEALLSVPIVRWLLALLLLFGLAGQATAAVEIAFYSRELGGNNFPHAFVSLRGTVDSTGERVDTSYGFTARAVTPAILLGSVAGEVVVEGPRQIARSELRKYTQEKI